MKARWWLLVVCLLSVNVFSQEEQSDEAIAPEPLDPAYEGIHGMLVFNQGSSLFASHFALYRKPHNAQIIYKLEAKDPSLVFLVRDADMVTIKPQKFNLQRLIRGEELTIKADVYIGHFERGGSKTYEQVELTFTKQVYVRMLEDLGSPVSKQTYEKVDIGKGALLLVHQIQGEPSYDHLIILYQNIGCITDVDTGEAVPNETRLINRLSFCGSMKPVYYETQDFAETASHSMGSHY